MGQARIFGQTAAAARIADKLAIAKAIMDSFTYTGVMLQDIKFMDGNPYVLLTFETSGLLTVDGDYTGDVWMCGGGGAGGYGSQAANPGPGGGGGYTSNTYGIPITSGEIIIGSAGYYGNATSTGRVNGGASQYAGISANGGTTGGVTNDRVAGDGGSGGGGATLWFGQVVYTIRAGKGQGSTTRPFESQDMPPYCAGGGAGRYYYDKTEKLGGDGGSDGSDGTATGSGTCLGGDYGGGYGSNNSEAGPGTKYGCGGGGGSYMTAQNGYPGAVMIRIPL